MQFQLIVGKFRYALLSDNSIFWKKFEAEELQDIVAELIEGYLKDGEPLDIWKELFSKPIKHSFKDDKLIVTLEIGEFTVDIGSEKTIEAILKQLQILDLTNGNYKKQILNYEGVLKDSNLLNKKFKLDLECIYEPTKALDLVDHLL